MQKRASVSRGRCYIYSTTTILTVCVPANEGECLEMTLLNECLSREAFGGEHDPEKGKKPSVERDYPEREKKKLSVGSDYREKNAILHSKLGKRSSSATK